MASRAELNDWPRRQTGQREQEALFFESAFPFLNSGIHYMQVKPKLLVPLRNLDRWLLYRSETMGDKGGKKAKDKSQKQHSDKVKHKEQVRIQKQPAKKA